MTRDYKLESDIISAKEKATRYILADLPEKSKEKFILAVTNKNVQEYVEFLIDRMVEIMALNPMVARAADRVVLPLLSVRCQCGAEIHIQGGDIGEWALDMVGVWKFKHMRCGNVVEVPDQAMREVLSKLKDSFLRQGKPLL